MYSGLVQFHVRYPGSQIDHPLQIELMDTVLSLLEVVSYLIFFTFWNIENK